MSVISTLARWMGGRDELSTEVNKRQSALDAHNRAKPKGIDIQSHAKWHEGRRKLEIDLQAAQAALEVATAETAKAQAVKDAADKAAADEAAKRAAHENAKLGAKLTRQIEAKSIELANILKQLVDANAAVVAYNREHRPLNAIRDGEWETRHTPARHIPASYGEVERWMIGGRECTSFHKDPQTGEMVPQEFGAEKKLVRVCHGAERDIPAKMPRRFADEIKLVDLAGKQIWPLR